MPAMLKMSVPLAARLANRKAGRAYRNECWPRYTAQDARGVYYVAAGALREVGACDDIHKRIGHTGWYVDRECPDPDEVMRGYVYALPARNGKRRLVAGYRYTGGDDDGANLYFNQIFDDEIEAARMADEHARAVAERECDYQDEERERLAAEEAENERLDNLAECHPPLVLQ